MQADAWNPATALVIEDDPFAQFALRQYLEAKQFNVISATTYAEARRLIASQAPPPLLGIVDLALRETDESVPAIRDAYGIELVHTLKRLYPQIAIVIWTAYFDGVARILPLLTRGYTGLACVAKGSPESALNEAITRALSHDVYLHHSIVMAHPEPADAMFLKALGPELAPVIEQIAARFAELTPRQREVAERMTCTTDIIAQQLGLTVMTVRKYTDAIYERLELKEDSNINGFRRDAMIVLAHTLRRMRAVEE